MIFNFFNYSIGAKIKISNGYSISLVTDFLAEFFIILETNILADTL